MNLKEQKKIAEQKLKNITQKLEEKQKTLTAKKEGKTRYYHFRQNNSGGHFVSDKKLAIHTFIQAHSAEEANSLADNIGIYFDGCETGLDCNCCGDRWYPVREDDGEHKSTPQIWADNGTNGGNYVDIHEAYKDGGFSEEARIHHLNGKIEIVKFKTYKDCPKHEWYNPHGIGQKCKTCHEWQKYLPKEYGGLGAKTE